MKTKIGRMSGAMLLAAALCGCGNADGEAAAAAQSGEGDAKLKIVTTIYPEYDWVEQILGERADAAELTLLVDNGLDPHSYQPSAGDIVTISTCDIFVYVGGESDGWVRDILAGAQNKDMIVIDLLETLGDAAREEEIVEGMEAEEEGEEGIEEEPEYDEHVWLSLRNAAVFCDAIAEGLGQADPENAEVYLANAENYKTSLSALDEEYRAAVEGSANRTLLFADRFPFRYLTEDYGLDYYAAFAGCSAETEASFETVLFLAGKAGELGLQDILVIDGSDGKLAETVKGATPSKDQQILTLNSLQSVSLKDARETGMSYLSAMRENLEVLKDALDPGADGKL